MANRMLNSADGGNLPSVNCDCWYGHLGYHDIICWQAQWARQREARRAQPYGTAEDRARDTTTRALR